jgi:hypothetical protein
MLEDYAELQRVYGILGERDKVGLFANDLPHGMDFFSRREIYGWFNRWFGKEDAGVEEAPFDTGPDEALNATPTGQVSSSYSGRSIIQLNSDRARALLPASPFRNQPIATAQKQVRQQLASLLALPAQRTPLKGRTLSSNVRRDQRIQEVQFEPEPGVRILGWFVEPLNGKKQHPCVLYISDGYADEAIAEPSPLDPLLQAGVAVYAIALRGTGVSTPRPPRGGPVFYQQLTLTDRYAWANLVLGKSVIGQRVWDVLRAFEYIAARPEVDPEQIHILGQEEAGLTALMAAVLENQAKSILLAGTPASYLSVVETKDYVLPLEWYVHGILRHFDLADLAAAMTPRPITLVNAVDGAGNVMSEGELHAQYAKRLGESSSLWKHLTIRNEPAGQSTVYRSWLRAM